jgi:hypothetical protein
MAILYGTTGDGTTLPVLVDQFGNLLAKGIDGPEGPPGPPGIGQLPEDPFEGAILGWEDGELSWLGGSVPLPSGTYGPYIYSDTEGTLTVPQDVSTLVNGQQLIMTDEEGISISVLVETSAITNVNGNVLTFVDNSNFDLLYEGQVVQGGVQILNISGSSNPPKITVSGGSWYAMPPVGDGTGDAGDGRYEPAQEWSSTEFFDNNGNAYINTATSQTLFDGVAKSGTTTDMVLPAGAAQAFDLNFGDKFAGATEISIYHWSSGGSSLLLNGRNLARDQSNVALWETFPVTGFQSLQWGYNGGNNYDYIGAIKVDGKLLVDTSAPGGPGATKISKNESGTGSVFTGTGNTIVLRNNNREWIDGYYVTAPEQRIAARKVTTAAIRRKTK